MSIQLQPEHFPNFVYAVTLVRPWVIQRSRHRHLVQTALWNRSYHWIGLYSRKPIATPLLDREYHNFPDCSRHRYSKILGKENRHRPITTRRSFMNVVKSNLMITYRELRVDNSSRQLRRHRNPLVYEQENDCSHHEWIHLRECKPSLGTSWPRQRWSVPSKFER